MADQSPLSAHEAALASERKDRAVAMLGLPELIAGVQVEPLTPRRLEWLRAMGNPFICGGHCPTEAIPDFLWYVSSCFEFGNDEKRREFLASILSLDVEEAREGIDEYLDRAFLDAPTGKESVAYYSTSAGLYHSLNVSYPGAGWHLERVLDTPLRVTYQLIKAADRERGCSLVNRRSFAAQAEWASTLERIEAPTYEELGDVIDAMRTQGYRLYEDPMRKVQPEMSPEEKSAQPWFCLMRKDF